MTKAPTGGIKEIVLNYKAEPCLTQGQEYSALSGNQTNNGEQDHYYSKTKPFLRFGINLYPVLRL